MHFEDARSGETAHQSLPNFSGIRTGFRCEYERFGDCLDIERNDDLIGDFGRLPGSVVTDERDVLAHQVEKRLHLVEHGLWLAPTMIVSAPFFAPTSPPDTGAST